VAAWDTDELRLMTIARGDRGIATLSPDGRRIAVAMKDGSVAFYETPNGAPSFKFIPEDGLVDASAVSFSAGAKRAAFHARSSGKPEYVSVNLDAKKVEVRGRAQDFRIGIAVNDDGLLAVCDGRQGLTAYGANGDPLFSVPFEPTKYGVVCHTVRFSPDESLLVVGGIVGNADTSFIHVYDVAKARRVAALTVEGQATGEMAIAFSNDGSYMAVGGVGREGTEGRVYDRRGWQRLAEFAGLDTISTLSFSTSGQCLATYRPDGRTGEVFDLYGRVLLSTGAEGLSFAHGNRLIIARGARLWVSSLPSCGTDLDLMRVARSYASKLVALGLGEGSR
jgi:WD40 repeat protein